MAKKASKKAAKPRPPGGQPSSSEADAFMLALKHPMKSELQSLRQLILSVSPKIADGIKWNSLSFRTTEWFATANIAARTGSASIRLILHFGAKARSGATAAARIKDPSKMLQWLGKDRAMVLIGDTEELESMRPGLKAVLKQWIGFV